MWRFEAQKRINVGRILINTATACFEALLYSGYKPSYKTPYEDE